MAKDGSESYPWLTEKKLEQYLKEKLKIEISIRSSWEDKTIVVKLILNDKEISESHYDL